MTRRRRKRTLDFFEELEELEALDSSGFFNNLAQMIREDEIEKQKAEEYRIYRAKNAEKARRIYPRLKFVENYPYWARTSHITPDFFGSIKDRVKAAKVLYEKRERLRWFLRALYNYWMFDIPMSWATPYMGLKYSRHRKYFLKKYREHKRNARKKRRTTLKQLRQLREQQAKKALDSLRSRKLQDQGLEELDEIDI